MGGHEDGINAVQCVCVKDEDDQSCVRACGLQCIQRLAQVIYGGGAVASLEACLHFQGPASL